MDKLLIFLYPFLQNEIFFSPLLATFSHLCNATKNKNVPNLYFIEEFYYKLIAKQLTDVGSATRKNRQMSIKISQKWFH